MTSNYFSAFNLSSDSLQIHLNFKQISLVFSEIHLNTLQIISNTLRIALNTLQIPLNTAQILRIMRKLYANTTNYANTLQIQPRCRANTC